MVFGAGSAAAALCTTPEATDRVPAQLMGVGAAMVMPTTLSIITSSFAPGSSGPRPSVPGSVSPARARFSAW